MLFPLHRDTLSLLQSIAVRLNDVYVCRKHLHVLFEAVTELDTASVSDLAMWKPSARSPGLFSDGEESEDSEAGPPGGSGGSPPAPASAAAGGSAERDSDADSDPDSDADSAPGGAVRSDEPVADAIARGTAATFESLVVWKVTVTVASAQGLPRMDMHGLGRSDPYACLYLCDTSVVENPAVPEVRSAEPCESHTPVCSLWVCAPRSPRPSAPPASSTPTALPCGTKPSPLSCLTATCSCG